MSVLATPSRAPLATNESTPLMSIIIPAKDEEQRIQKPLDDLQLFLDARYPGEHEILVVDDGSRDRTADIARIAGVDVLRLEQNCGKGAALRAGMLAANGSDVRAFCDADGSFAPDDVVRLIETVLDRTADIAIGQRLAGSDQHEELLRRLGSRAVSIVGELILPTGISDTQCGTKAFRSAVALDLFRHSQTNGFGIDREILYGARRSGYTVRPVPVPVSPKDGSTVRPLHHGRQMVKELWCVRQQAKATARSFSYDHRTFSRMA